MDSISIIIPVYNVEKYVEECIRSVMNQIGTTDEVIIIDDGSTDDSYDICRHVIDEKENILLLQQKNRGLGATRNYGLSIAKGEYILFLDSDDILTEDALKELKVILADYSVDMLLFDADIFGDDGLMPKRNSYDRKNVRISEVLSGRDMFVAMYPRYYRDSAVLSIYRREFLKNAQAIFPEGILHEDVPFSFETMMKAKRVLHISKKLYLRRYRADSITTSSWSFERWYGRLIGNMDIWKYIESKSEMLTKSSTLANMVALYIFRSLREILETEKEEYLRTSRWTYEDIIDSFLKVWNLYYNNDIDSFIKWKCSCYIIDFIEDNKIVLTSNLIRNLWYDSDKIIAHYERYIRAKLNQLPFWNKELCVGIYGIGRHTAELLNCYRKLMGEIECEYFFIDSYIEEQNIAYLGKEVRNINEVGNLANVIVVSSFFHQKAMNDKIDDVLGHDFLRICLYNKNDEMGYFG